MKVCDEPFFTVALAGAIFSSRALALEEDEVASEDDAWALDDVFGVTVPV